MIDAQATKECPHAKKVSISLTTGTATQECRQDERKYWRKAEAERLIDVRSAGEIERSGSNGDRRALPVDARP